MQDPTEDIFVTFSSHSQCNSSLNLGSEIYVHKFEFLGKEIKGVYDGMYLLQLPKAITNETYIQVKYDAEFCGPLLNHATITTKNFELNSNMESI